MRERANSRKLDVNTQLIPFFTIPEHRKKNHRYNLNSFEMGMALEAGLLEFANTDSNRHHVELSSPLEGDILVDEESSGVSSNDTVALSFLDCGAMVA
jgi:hypothetical protein